MRKKRIYTIIFTLISGLFFNACSINGTENLEPQKPQECPKPAKQDIFTQDKENVINIDKVVMIMPEEEKKAAPAKPKTVVKKVAPKKKKKPIKKKTVQKVKEVKKTEPKKTVVTAPKKLIKKKEDIKKIEKNIGDRVCRNGKGLMGFMPLDLTGEVKKKKAESIQVRIIDSRSDNPVYDGIGLYKNTMVWDKHYNWKLCK